MHSWKSVTPGFCFVFSFKEGIKARVHTRHAGNYRGKCNFTDKWFHRKTWSKSTPHRWTSTFFYSAAKWSLAGRFLLPPEPNMLSSESIIHKPDTSSTSTPANYSATVCCHRAPHAASHANCVRSNVNGLVYCCSPPKSKLLSTQAFQTASESAAEASDRVSCKKQRTDGGK